MDRVQTVVTVELLHRVFAGVAVAAKNLDRQFVGLEAERRGPGFDDRGQQVEQVLRQLAGVFVSGRMGVVEQARGVQAQVKGAFYVAFCARSMRFTSVCSMIGTAGLCGSLLSGSRPCGRWRAYSRE